MPPPVLNLADKLAKFTDHWSPRVLAEVNNAQVKLVKLLGPFVWHAHDAEDELFLVLHGVLRMRFRDGDRLVRPGEAILVPRGVEHCPEADEEVHVLLVEPATTLNTGDAVGDSRTKPTLERA